MAKDSITRDECISTHNSLMEQLNDIKKDVNNVALKVAELPGVLVEKFDERYASKETERTVNKVMWLVVSAVILAGLAIIVRWFGSL